MHKLQSIRSWDEYEWWFVMDVYGSDRVLFYALSLQFTEKLRKGKINLSQGSWFLRPKL